MLPPPETMPLSAWHTAIAAILMAIWWCTEAVHVSVTAIVPLAIFPLLGIGDIKTVAAPYAVSYTHLTLPTPPYV